MDPVQSPATVAVHWAAVLAPRCCLLVPLRHATPPRCSGRIPRCGLWWAMARRPWGTWDSWFIMWSIYWESLSDPYIWYIIIIIKKGYPIPNSCAYKDYISILYRDLILIMHMHMIYRSDPYTHGLMIIPPVLRIFILAGEYVFFFQLCFFCFFNQYLLGQLRGQTFILKHINTCIYIYIIYIYNIYIYNLYI